MDRLEGARTNPRPSAGGGPHTWPARRVRWRSLGLALGALLLTGAHVGAAQAAAVKGYGELARFGEATTSSPAAAGEIRSEGVHRIGVDPADNSVYVLDEPEAQEETGENKQGEIEVTRHFRLQKFSASGTALAAVSFEHTGPGEEIEEYEAFPGEEPLKTIEGVAVDAKRGVVYVLAVDLRKALYERPKKELFEEDAEAPVASTLYAFSTTPNKKGKLVGAGVKGPDKEVLANPATLEAQSTEPGHALLEPAGITVDPATGDVLILAHEDPQGNAADNLLAAEDHYVVQAVTPEGALSTRYVDTGNVLKEPAAPPTPGLEAYPNSPVVTGQPGSEHIVLSYGGSLVEIPASLSSATPPSYLYRETEEFGLLSVVTGASLTRGGGLSVSPEGVLFGMAHIEDELESTKETEPGVVLRSAASGAEIGWSGGQSPALAEAGKCVLEAERAGQESNATLAAGSEGTVFVLAPAFLGQPSGPGTRAIVELGPGGSGCPQAMASSVYAEVGGHEVEEGTPILEHTAVTFGSELDQDDALASTWSFGDGGEEAVSADQYRSPQSAPHSFEAPGEYTVTATISSDDLAAPNQVIFNGSSFITPTLTATGKVLIAGSPTASTGQAGSLMKTSATLHGTVDPNSAEVEECSFEYGKTLPSGKTVACEPSPGDGHSAVPVSAPLTGLEVDTTYRYRLIARNKYGTSEGAEESFTTLPTTPSVKTEAASDVQQSSAILHATVDPNAGQVAECRFEYGTTLPSHASAPCEPLPGSGTTGVAVSAQLSGLSASTVYDFRIIATNEAGPAVEGEALSLTTAAPPPTSSSPGPGQQPSQQSVLSTLSSVAPAVPDVVLASSSLTASASGVLRVKLSCPAAASSCTGAITLRTLSAVLASASKSKKPAILTLASSAFDVAGGADATVTLHLSSVARTLLARSHTLRARATILAHDPAGASYTTTTIVTIRAAKAKAKHKG